MRHLVFGVSDLWLRVDQAEAPPGMQAAGKRNFRWENTTDTCKLDLCRTGRVLQNHTESRIALEAIHPRIKAK